MKILTVETSTKNLGIAISDDTTILAEYRSKKEFTHAEEIIPSINSLLNKASLKLNNIDALAMSIGPGSFTGLRVGVSTLKGMNLATNIPIIAIPTLDVIAYNVKDKSAHICTIIDAKKGNLYTSLYQAENGGIIRKWDYSLVSQDEFIEKPDSIDCNKSSMLFVGDGITRSRDLIKKKYPDAICAAEDEWYPRPEITAILAVDRFEDKKFEDPDRLIPMYIYSRECSIKGIER